METVEPPRAASGLSKFRSPQGWIDLNPALGLVDRSRAQRAEMLRADPATIAMLKDALHHEGYFHVPQVNWNLPLEEMGIAIARIKVLGLPEPFCFVYDEFWLVFSKLHILLGEMLGQSYKMMPGFWAWHVDPKNAQSGWKPHRDRGRVSLYPDGHPKSLTVWMTLTEATPLNGCIYLVPADRDPTFNTEQEGEWKFKFQDIRALPSPAGGLFCWNQALVHWGSRSSPRAVGPRVSLSFEFQRGDIAAFDEPLLAPLTFLNFEQRLALICKQVLQYKHMYPLSPELEEFATSTLA